MITNVSEIVERQMKIKDEQIQRLLKQRYHIALMGIAVGIGLMGLFCELLNMI